MSVSVRAVDPCLLDIRMPGSGVAAAWEIAARPPHLARGLSTAEIAQKLVLSASAVRVHIASIVRKLKVADRRAVVDLFRRSGT